MNRIVEGIELLRMIRDGELKANTELVDSLGEMYKYEDDVNGNLTLYKKDYLTGEYYTPDYSFFTDKDNEFEIIEDDEKEIDIDSIEELSVPTVSTEEALPIVKNRIKINELIKAVKQINKNFQ